ncbi:MAG: 23S rRNA pseudouridine(1911/1915/1917) synthase RluD [Pseudomonadota bacterium]
MNNPSEQIVITLPDSMRGQRLDKVLPELVEGYSRSELQRWLKSGHVLMDGAVQAQKYKILGGETLVVQVPDPELSEWLAEDIALEIVHSDDEFFVINKPAGLVVHPGAGNSSGTLMNGLIYIDERLRMLPRAGIVHRLDKDTTGLMVVARTERARQSFIEQLQDRTMSRQYLALVQGVLIAGETIDQPIARHRQDRLRMTVTSSGKEAITHIRIEKKFDRHTLVRAFLQTGRTHQIRVHMQWKGYPLVGDSVYGGRAKIPAGANENVIQCLRSFPRQALHATRLSFSHPKTGEDVSFESGLPEDMNLLLNTLQDND